MEKTGRPGLPAAKRERYLYGDCALLALAIHAKTGWEVVEIKEGPPEDPDIRHVLIRMPGGELLDADGLHRDYSGETPFQATDWDVPESMWRDQVVLADAEELLRSAGAA